MNQQIKVLIEIQCKHIKKRMNKIKLSCLGEQSQQQMSEERQKKTDRNTHTHTKSFIKLYGKMCSLLTVTN